MRAELEIEARRHADEPSMRGQLTGREGNLLYVQLDSLPADPNPLSLTGAFCEVRLQLSGDLFQFTTCVLEVSADTPVRQMTLAVPESIQVTNRRRFERFQPPAATQVRVWPDGQPAPAIGMLLNVGLEGLACSLPGLDSGDNLLLGDTVRLLFDLPGCDESFELDGIVCNKTPSEEGHQLVVGFAFQEVTDASRAQQSHQRLRNTLWMYLLGDPPAEELS
jgi:hypothetical protein